MPGAQIPQPHVYEQGGGYSGQDATDATFGFALEHSHAHGQHPHRAHGRRWSQPNAGQYGQYGQPVDASYAMNNVFPQYHGQMHYHMSPPSSPPTTPDVQVHAAPPHMSLAGRSRRLSRTSGPTRRNSSPSELGRRATAPSGQRIILLPKAVNGDLLHHQLDYDEQDYA
mmetsp:Transcript_19716/g.35662  ORF Transcript_19716/g.35662 Transcript_19716/m.35662 type:complete len:169 (-) Transcript_19716:249-755(-)|eukprot:CAMPEP_0205903602 /NCGR_PEP_ID=MMETSP1325-20131115/200_1 /ASSEMBLY_ACC=CAM_ASM_000708 /TAXON_ID=236786 /ORGANISM="Florenciella sp., Strain RCC1007" /LENGTH=168 /DNA_ID=CAMNT_0053269273 /DNA_START=314 /DNA_END=820 /DNA_ORIENTATION=+